jgi:hypothetical protein
MNLQSWMKSLFVTPLNFQRRRDYFCERIFGQNVPAHLQSFEPFMILLSSVRRAAACLCWGLFLAIPAAAFGQTNYYTTNGTEYAIIGSLPGDQVFPDVAVNTNGGFVVWQDNITDGDGWGVSARQVDGTLSGTLGTFRVNKQGAGDQENSRVALLKNGGAAFVWQGGPKGFQHIYGAFVNSSNVFVNTNDISVNPLSTNIFYSYTTNSTTTITTNWSVFYHRIIGYTTNTTTTVTTNTTGSAVSFQNDPVVTVLNNSNVVFVWASFDEAGPTTLEDVYGRIFSPTGQPLTGEFLINQFTPYNQYSPTVAALGGGGFVVAWISEQERVVAASASPNPILPSQISNPSVDVYARLYDGSGTAQGNEFLVNTDSNPCATPAVAAASDGTFMIAWCARDMVNANNGLDIFARVFSSAGVGGTTMRVNSYTYGYQYAPRISSLGTDYMIVWTSLGQDGSREGVYGQFFQSSGSSVGGEFRVNTTTISQQMEPTVTSDGASQFVAVWTSYTGGSNTFDLFAQRYINTVAVLQPMAAPFVYAPFVISNGVYQPQLQVSWPPLLGLPVSNYEVYVDGATTNIAVTASNVWTMTAANGLTVSSTHSFRVDYMTTDSRRSPLSPSASGATWSGLNYYGIPDEWMAEFFGGYSGGIYHTNFWPSANTPLTPGGPTLYQVFLSGGNPLDSTTWLTTQLSNTPQGLFLTWNTQPGQTYQVQVTTNMATWSNLGAPRFAAGDSDSIFVGGAPVGYYRVVLLRQ